MALPDKQHSPIQAGLDDSAELERRIKALPQELQDEILDLTVTIKPTTVVIDRCYKPPWQLSISQTSRHKAAQEYYSSSIFRAEDVDVDEKRPDIWTWLKSLPSNHRHFISEIRLSWRAHLSGQFHNIYNTLSSLHAEYALNSRIRETKHEFGMEESVFKTRMVEEGSLGETHELWLSREDARAMLGRSG